MFIFQEFIEDILELNNNISLSKFFIDEETVVLDIKDLNNIQILINTNDDGETFELRYVENGFIDSIYKSDIFEKDELSDFLVNLTAKNIVYEYIQDYSYKGIMLSSWFEKNDNVKLLGIFIKQGYFFEDTYDEYELHQHNDILFYVQGKEKAIISFEARDGMCGSGYCTASFGSAFAAKVEKAIDMEKAIFIPTEDIFVTYEQGFDGGSLYLGLNKKDKIMVVNYDEYGGDSYYPSGYVNTEFPLDSQEIKAKCVVSPEDDDAFVKLKLKLNPNYQKILPINPHVLIEM